MVGSISSNTQMMPPQGSSRSGSNQSLTQTQLDVISSTLSQYDASNLTKEDATTIVETFKEAGIKPSEALAKAMEAEGFDAKEVGDTAGIARPKGEGGMPPPPPKNDEQEQSDILNMLDTLLSLGEDEEESSSTSSFSEIMEYTSRILNLNESSKSEVMNMLDKFSSNEDEYSDEEVSNIIKNSLSSILSDADNYNRVSFYA